MPFEKGHKINGNLKGRPKGTKNNKTIVWEMLGESVISEGAEKVKEYLDTLNGEDHYKAWLNVVEYFKPKQQRTEHAGEVKTKSALDDMTFEEAYLLKYGHRPGDK